MNEFHFDEKNFLDLIRDGEILFKLSDKLQNDEEKTEYFSPVKSKIKDSINKEKTNMQVKNKKIN